MLKALLHIKYYGFSLVEALLAGVIFSLVVMTLVGSLIYGEETGKLSGSRVRAVLLAEEGLEAVRNMRDDNFTNLFNGTYGLASSGDIWSFSGSEDISGIYTRKIIVAQIDSERKQVTSQVTWQQNGQRTGTVSLVTYLTDWIHGTGPTPTPPPGWSNPVFQTSLDPAGAQDGLKVQVQGNFAYVVRTGGTPNFIIYDVSNPAIPTVSGSLTLTGAPNNIAVSGDFAYVASGDNAEELQIIDVTTPTSPSVSGTFNAAGGADALGVWVSGTTVYLSRTASTSDELVIVDATTPTSPSLLGSLDLGAGGTGNEIIVLGTQAYIASSAATELFVVNVSNPAAPALTVAFDASGGSNALTVTGFSSTVVLGRADNTLGVIDVTTPASPSVTGTVNVGGNVNDIALGFSNTFAFLATTLGTAEFQVVDISNPALPSVIGTLNLTGANQLRGIAYDQTLDRAFAASADNAAEFQIFRPGP